MYRTSTIARDGRALNTFVSGHKPDVPTVLLVLPFGARHQMMERLYVAVQDCFNVITWESRFVLDPERDTQDDEIAAEAHAHDLIDVLTAAAQGPVDVIAFCSGAGIALLAARLAPEKISRLVLVSGEYLLSATDYAQTDVQRQMDIFMKLAARSRSLAGSIQEKIAATQVRASNEFQPFLSEPFSSAQHLHRYGINYAAYSKLDIPALATKIDHPALSIVSTRDDQVSPAGSIAVAQMLGNFAGSVAIEGDHYELCRGNADVVRSIVGFLVPDEVSA